MNKETLKYLITEFHEKALPAVLSRTMQLPVDSGKIIALTGIRRSGKTFLMYQTIHQLLQKGVPKENILYLNFEDDRLFPIQLQEMDLILKAFHELHPEKIDDKKYLFFDEIQNVQGWERYCRRICDHEQVSLFISGSSSHLLAGEIATSLRGRSVTFQVYPLSFAEFLHFKNIDVKPFSERSRVAVEHSLDQYLAIGGFPEVVQADELLRPKILQEYADLLLYKDLIEQYELKNQYLLKYLLKICFSNPATLLSTNKLYNDLKSQGVSASKNTLYEYLEYMQNAFILFATAIYDRSLRKQLQNPKKLYVIDIGLVSRFVANPLADLGRKLENMVFLHLKRQEKSVYYYRNTSEIDLVYETGEHEIFVNVCHHFDQPSTLEREIASLASVHKKYPQAKILLLSRNKPSQRIPDFIESMSVVEFFREW